jgi:hypothetical protein
MYHLRMKHREEYHDVLDAEMNKKNIDEAGASIDEK